MTRLRPALLSLLALLALLAPTATAAQAGAAAEAVRARAAARLGVEPAAVRVEWSGAAIPAPDAVRLIGSGAGGSFLAELTVGDDVVRRRIRVGVRTSVAVAARDLERGSALADGDILWRDTVLWGGRRPEAPAAGWVVRRRIAAGTRLAAPAVSPPDVVEAGREVLLVWRGGGLEVTARAVAAGTAARGERVAVRTESGRRLWGIAESPGRVRLEGSNR